MTARLLPLVLAACAGSTADDPIPGDTDADTDADVFHPPDAAGPYPVGVTTLRYTDVRGKDMIAEVWYPARPAPGDPPDPYDEIPIAMSANRDVPAERGGAPYPLVAFSHGLGGIRYQSATLTEHLASHGYVVVAPDHPGNVLLDAFFPADITGIILERPDDVRYAVDEALAASSTPGERLEGMVLDDGRYAMIGHSFGAFTALVLGGGVWDGPGAKRYCDEVDAFACQYVGDLDLSRLTDQGTVDPRVDVIVPLSPGVWYAFGEDGVGLSSTVESFVLAGTADGVLDYEDENLPTWERLGSPTRLVSIDRTGHYAAFSNMCALFASWEDCGGEADGLRASDAIRPVVESAVLSFLKDRYTGDDRYAPGWSAEAFADDPGILVSDRRD